MTDEIGIELRLNLTGSRQSRPQAF